MIFVLLIFSGSLDLYIGLLNKNASEYKILGHSNHVNISDATKICEEKTFSINKKRTELLRKGLFS
jgi:hypothetical protein